MSVDDVRSWRTRSAEAHSRSLRLGSSSCLRGAHPAEVERLAPDRSRPHPPEDRREGPRSGQNHRASGNSNGDVLHDDERVTTEAPPSRTGARF